MNKTLVGLIIILIIVAAIVVTNSTDYVVKDSRAKEVKVGAILGLTGDFAIFGSSLQKGIDIAVDDINSMHAIDAAVKEKGIGQKEIKDGLYEISFDGATGKINFDETGMSPRYEKIFVIKNNTPVLIG